MSGRRILLVMLLAAASVLTACGGSSSSSSQAAAASSTTGTATAPTTTTTTSAAAATTATATTTTSTSTAPAKPPPYGPEGIPLEKGPVLAPAGTTSQGATVDGIQCAPVEQLVYHIHSHLQVYVEGKPRTLPPAIGMVGPVSQQTPYGPFYGAQQCYYWLHTHASDGVIHVESPSVRIYTLGNFFDEWNQPLSRNQVAGDKGKVTALLNEKPWTQDPTAIPLIPHASIQLDVGSPVVRPHEISWAGTNL